MVHQYKLNGYNIVLDTCSGAIHVVDEVAYDIIAMIKEKDADQITEEIMARYGHRDDVTEEEVRLCIEDVNGLIAAGSRGIYALAARNEGPAPDLFRQVDQRTGMPHNSVLFGAMMVAFWVFFYYGGPLSGWFGVLSFDSSELPIVSLYASYIPIFVMMMKREKGLHPVKRYVMPVLAILSCLFIVGAAVASHGVDVLWYLLVFAVIMVIGLLLRGKGYRKLD
jgi:amino acid transporter